MKKSYLIKRMSIVFMLMLICNIIYSDEGDGVNSSYTPRILPPSPTASELGRYGYIPVGLFTGTPNVNIPLHTFKTKNLSIPISLSYNSNGVKVDQISSWVGMSWSLNAGGVITRVVRDGADDTHARLIPDDISGNTFEVKNFLDYVSNYSIIDTEPDLFSFNIGGISGQFLFDDNFNIVTVPYQNLHVETDISPNDPDAMYEIIITTNEGVKYIFGGSEDFVEKTNTISYGQGGCRNDFEEPVITAWYLNKIIHPLGDIIYFLYNNHTYQYLSGVNETIRKTVAQTDDGCSGGGECGTDVYTTCYSKLYVKTLRLAEISSNEFGKITFTSTQNGRTDLNDYRLTKIALKDDLGQELRSFNFEQIFSSNTNHINPEFQNTEELKHRMFLSSINIKDANNTLQGTYTFDYNDINGLPARLSFSQDHWGYYNGASNFDFAPNPGNIYNNIFNGIGGNRKPDSIYATKGILEKVTYPTGGYDELYWEANSYNDDITIYPAPTEISLQINGEAFSYGQNTTETISIPYNQPVNPISVQVNVSYDNSYNDYNYTHHMGKLVITDLSTSPAEEVLYKSIHVEDSPYIYFFYPTVGHNYEFKLWAYGEQTTSQCNFSYYDQQTTTTNMNQETGGLRIKSVTTKAEEDGTPETTHYYYAKHDELDKSTGYLNHQPVYFNTKELVHSCSDVPCNTFTCKYVTLYSNSQNNLYDFGPNLISYSHVTVSKGDNFENGAEETKFKVAYDEPAALVRGNPISGTSYINYGWPRGLKEYTKIFKKSGLGDLFCVKENYFEYETEDTINFNESKGIVVRKNFDLICENLQSHECTYEETINPIIDFDEYQICSACYGLNEGDIITFNANLGNFDIMQYPVYSYWNYLEEETEILYDENGDNEVTTITNYYYDNSEHAQLSRAVTYDSEGNKITKKMYYPEDYYQGISEIDQLIANNITAIPIDIRTYNENSLTSGKVTKFNELGQPVEIYAAETELGTNLLFYQSNPYSYGTKKISFWYESNHNLSYFQPENGYTTTFLWGYDYTYPVARIENTKHIDALIALNASTTYTALQNITDEDDLILLFKTMRDHIKMENAQIHSYTYKPLFGISTVTEPKSTTIYYEYDDFQRLEFIKNDNEDVLESYDYNYRNN